MALRALADPSPADWFVDPQYDWRELVSIGPRGYEAYARVHYDLDDDSTVDVNAIMTQAVRNILEPFTSTPDNCFFGWWVGIDTPLQTAGPIFSVDEWIDGKRSDISMRDYHLFGGSVADGRDFEVESLDLPHLMWPADRAWFMAADTDSESWFGVAGTRALIDQLLTDSSVNAVEVPYGEGAGFE